MVLFIVGFIFCAIEVFVPGFGFFGISGTIMVVAGIVIRLLQDGDAMMLLYMITISLLFFFLLFFVFSRLVTKGKLSKTALFNVGTAVSEEKTEGTKDFTYLCKRKALRSPCCVLSARLISAEKLWTLLHVTVSSTKVKK